MFRDIIAQLGDLMGLPNLRPSGRDTLSLSIDGEIFTLLFFDSTKEIYIVCSFGSLPVSEEEATKLMRFFLTENCFFKGVGGGAIGIKNDVSYYTYRFDLEKASAKDLYAALQATVETCLAIKKKMQTLFQTGPSGNEITDPELMTLAV